MRYYIITLLFLVIFSCQKKVVRKNDPSISIEAFEDFFQNFKKDTSFRKNRTKNPCLYKTFEVDDDSGKENIKVEELDKFPIDFNINDNSVYYKMQLVSKDTVKIISGIKETGYLIHVVFYREQNSGKWYALQIEDYST